MDLRKICRREIWREIWQAKKIAWIALVLSSSFCVSSFQRHCHGFSSEYGHSNFSSIRWVSEHVPTNSIYLGLTRGIGQASQSYSSWKWKKASQREEKDNERQEDTCVQLDLCHCRYRVIAVHRMNVQPSKQHFYKFLWLSVQWMRWETPNCLD